MKTYLLVSGAGKFNNNDNDTTSRKSSSVCMNDSFQKQNQRRERRRSKLPIYSQFYKLFASVKSHKSGFQDIFFQSTDIAKL